ncbi:putative protein TPRXL [Diabrotica virgifera virgifera]|uniref:Suppressor protein SRP40-like n=1 Tax=Diabrotica virgifera virgifera TaxID=50390 RepID=A0ABM5L2B8_DIAVI|nr:putative protein TPRXL [Diabrotica virgifera virgifera]
MNIKLNINKNENSKPTVSSTDKQVTKRKHPTLSPIISTNNIESFEDFCSDDSVKDPDYEYSNGDANNRRSSSSSSGSNSCSCSSSSSSSSDSEADQACSKAVAPSKIENILRCFSSSSTNEDETPRDCVAEPVAGRFTNNNFSNPSDPVASRSTISADIASPCIEGNENVNSRKERKRKATPNNWLRAKAKILRNSGKSYLSNSKKEMTIVPAKSLKAPCSEKCKQNCVQKITETQRQQIFDNYWTMGDLQRQREFILRHLSVVEPRYS